MKRAKKPPPLFDWAALFDWSRFVWGAARRHKKVGLAAAATTLFMTVVAVGQWPRHYESHTLLLVRAVHSVDDSQAWGAPWDEHPTRAAREWVLAKDSLERVVRQTDLVVQWRERRGILLRMKDQIEQLAFGVWTDEEWRDRLVGTLESRLEVIADEDTLQIRVTWPDAAMARRIVETTSQNFMETRHINSMAVLTDAVAILEQRSSESQLQVNAALENLQRVIVERAKGDLQRALARAKERAATLGRNATPQQVAQVRFTLRAKERELEELEQQRGRALTAARHDLEQQLVIFNRRHPAIAELERRVEALRREPPRVWQLRQEVLELRLTLRERGGTDEANVTNRAAAPIQIPHQATVVEATLASLPADLERDPSISVAQEQLRLALARYQEFLVRVQSAHLAMDKAQAAFRARFQVLQQPQTPRRPLSPHVPTLLLAGLLLSIMLGFLAAAAVDWWRGTVCELFQIERQLKVKLLVALGEVK